MRDFIELIIALGIVIWSLIWLRRFILVQIHLWREGLVSPGWFGMLELERQIRQKRMDERKAKRTENNERKKS